MAAYESYPGSEVLNELCQEVGFGCPLCGCPYLTWYHFDPPWEPGNSHRCEGMIALYLEHCQKAVQGSYTNEQLYQFKKQIHESVLKGSLDWTKNELLVVAGNTFNLNPANVITHHNNSLISFHRDKGGRFKTNFKLLRHKDLLLEMENNIWKIHIQPTQIKTPANGKKIIVDYIEGIKFELHFFELRSTEEFKKHYDVDFPSSAFHNVFPMTATQITYVCGDIHIQLNHKIKRIPGLRIQNSFTQGVHTVLKID